MSVLKILNQLSATNSSLEKLQILKDNQDNDLLKQVFYLAYNTQIRFWVKKRPELLCDIPYYTLPTALDMMVETIASRKLTGNAAITFIQDLMSGLDSDDREVLLRIIERDLKCGTGSTLANKTWKNLIPDYPVLLCNKLNTKTEKKIKYPAILQCKMDGGRANLEFKDGKCISITSRNGNEISIDTFDLITLKNTEHFILDGELLYAPNEIIAERTVGNGIINKAIRNTIKNEESKDLIFICWDIIPYGDFIKGECLLKYSDRFFQLNIVIDSNIKQIKVVESEIVNSKEESLEKYQRNLERGEEGCIIKNPDAIWNSKRSNDYLKMKAELTADLLVIGYKLGEPETKFESVLGALICTTSDSKLVVNVGSGFSDIKRENPESYVGKIVEVQYNSVISNKNSTTNSLFLPIFVGIREDKTEANSLSELL